MPPDERAKAAVKPRRAPGSSPAPAPGAAPAPASASPPTPYASGHEHIADRLARHDLLLKREIARGQRRKPTDILGFAAITEQEVQSQLRAADSETTTPSADLQTLQNATGDRAVDRYLMSALGALLVGGIVLVFRGVAPPNNRSSES